MTWFPPTRLHRFGKWHLRSSLQFVSRPDRTRMLSELSVLLREMTRQKAEAKWVLFTHKWEESYPLVVSYWSTHWESLMEHKVAYVSLISELINGTKFETNLYEDYHLLLEKHGPFKSGPELLK